MNHEEFSDGLTYLLKEMCRIVGVDFESIDFKKDGWYQDYTWTKEQENSFIDWAVEELKKNKELRKDILRFPFLQDVKSLRKAMMWFNFSYGWKVKDVVKKQNGEVSIAKDTLDGKLSLIED